MDRSILLDTFETCTMADWVVVKDIGAGDSSTVKMVYDPLRNTFAALKILSNSASRRQKLAFENEVKLLRRLNHPNLINFIDSYADLDYEDEQGKQAQLTAIALELASNGDLYEFLAKTGRFDDKIARTYFRQLINALEYCHNKGIAHNDIKPENILLDSEYNLKIVDFGLASQLNTARRPALVGTLGSDGYIAPELLSQGTCDGRKIDFFSAGVVLFLILSGNPPFARADYKDPCYKLLCSGKENLFWEQHEKNIVTESEEGIFCKDLRELLSSMLAIDPEDRPSIAQIKQNPWFLGPEATTHELKTELEKRSLKVQSLLTQVVLNKQDQFSHEPIPSEFSKEKILSLPPIQTSDLKPVSPSPSVTMSPRMNYNEISIDNLPSVTMTNIVSPSLPNISLN